MISSLKHYYQKEPYSCGPVCLKMVFEYLGIEYTENRLIRLCCAMPKAGTSHGFLISEVKEEGFEFIEKEDSKVEDIVKYIDLEIPVIVNYINPISNNGNYSVVVGYTENNNFIFADPTNGDNYVLSFKEFEDLWHDGDGESKGWMLVIGKEKY